MKILISAAFLVLAPSCWADPESLREAHAIRKEQAPSLCRMIALERELGVLVRDSRQTPQEFFSRSADDPDPGVKRAMSITRQIQELTRSEAERSQKLKVLAPRLTPEEKQEFQRELRLQLDSCHLQR